MHSNLNNYEQEWLQSFVEWTLNVGNDSAKGYTFLGGSELDLIDISEEFPIKNDNPGLTNLIGFVYLGLVARYRNNSYFQDCCILAPLINKVDKLNSRILAMLPNNSHTYLSSDIFLPTNIDFIIDDIYPSQMLHGMNFSEFLNHEIQLKVGAPIVLLRNLKPLIG